MSVNVNYCDTFLNALTNEYTTGDYVRTFGFYSPGDGGAAVYKVSQDLPDADKRISTTVAGVTFTYGDGKFYKTNSTVFELIPQGNKVYAEQFGVMPDNAEYYISNTTMLNVAVSYASGNGVRLEFASKGMYYLNSNISLKSNLFVDGNGAVLVQHPNAPTSSSMFATSSSPAECNITICNLSLIGRTREHYNPADQAFHVCINGFTLHNVKIKNFSFGVHTYGRYTNKGDYTVPEIPNKNWLIEGCSITDTVMGLQLSEIDGITIKDSTITSIYPKSFPVGTKGKNDSYDGHDYPEAYIFDKLGGLHNIYLSSNCLNVRINNVTMGNVTGDAIHKAFPPKADKDLGQFIRADISKNHFYTDLSIHKCNSPMTIGYISENVMCDNVFGTELRYLVYLSGVSNCIVANSSLNVNRDTFVRPDGNGTEITINANTGIRTEDAASCWFQNSYLYTNGRQRVGTYSGSGTYYYNMCVNEDVPVNIILDSTGKKIGTKTKKHNRSYIGSDFSIPNHWFKFTGCEIESTIGCSDYYFYEGYLAVVNPKVDVATRKNPCKSQYGEYWDNCSYTTNTTQDVFFLNCINDLLGGITIRNSYLENTELTYRYQPPFRIGCNRENRNGNSCVNVCPVYPDSCILSAYGKSYPWLRFENNFYEDKFSIYQKWGKWYFYIKDSTDNALMTMQNFVKFTGSYSSNCYYQNLNDPNRSRYIKLDNLDSLIS